MFNQYNPMMYQSIARPFSFTSILNNAQKTLNIVNQALPIVKEVKPIVKNARTLFGIAKGFNSINNEEIKPDPKTNNGLNFFV